MAKRKLTTDEAIKIEAVDPALQQLEVGRRLQDAEAAGVIFADVVGSTVAVVAPWDGKVVAATLVCTESHGGGTIKVSNGSDITNAMTCAAVSVTANATSVDIAYRTFSKGDLISFVPANGAFGEVTLICRRL